MFRQVVLTYGAVRRVPILRCGGHGPAGVQFKHPSIDPETGVAGHGAWIQVTLAESSAYSKRTSSVSFVNLPEFAFSVSPACGASLGMVTVPVIAVVPPSATRFAHSACTDAVGSEVASSEFVEPSCIQVWPVTVP